MTATLDETLAGADMEGGEVFCDDLYNNLKNHWRDNYGGEPCGSGGLEHLQPGMIISDSYDDRLYHITLVSGCPCSEILQACVPLSDDVYHGYGYDWDAMIGFDSTSDALILGLPLGVERGMIVCDAASIPHDFSALIPATALPTTFWSDADMDSYIAVGWAGDDLPDIWANRTLNIMYGAEHDVKFFTNAAAAENPYIYVYGWNGASAAPRYARMRMSDVNDEFVIATEDHADVEGITISLPETNQRFRIRQNADYIAMYCTATDAYLTWSDGALNLQTEEADTNSEVHIHGNGTGRALVDIFDEDDAEWLRLYIVAGAGFISTVGAAPGGLTFQYGTAQNVTCWSGIPAGNPYFYLYSWNTAAGATVYSRFQMSDVNDEFLIEAQNSANHEGITISLQETNQRFRVRQNADYMAMYLDGSHAYLTWSNGELNLQNTEADTIAEVHIHGNGTGRGGLLIYDEDDDEYLWMYSSLGRGLIQTTGVAPSYLALQYDIAQNIMCWLGLAAGNPDFRIYGWNTASATVRYGRFRMDDVNDEFLIEAENHADHEGITIILQEANQEFRLRGVGGVERFHIDQTGILGYMRQGELFQWTYQGDLADEADFTLPAFTDACWGFIQAGDNEEYALFSVDNVGNVTLISNSANVVANANTDGKLVLGIASPEEPLTIRNRLGATENINLIIWYS